jgi:hypothetical protein
MLGYVLNGSWSAGLMPIARSGTTILMPRPVTAGRLLRLPAPGAGLIGRWGGSIKCTSAYSSHATVASPGIRRANFLPLLRCTLTDTALIACKSFKVSRRCAVVCSVGSGASSALPGFDEACENVSATVVPLHAFVFGAREPQTVYPARMMKIELQPGRFSRRCWPVVTRPVDQTAGAAA